MRSYYAHLETAMGAKTIANKPIFRSSAIFPAVQLQDISSRILFMGYWILKRHIQQIATIVTLRSSEGKVLNRTNFIINEAKTFAIELEQQLAEAGLPSKDPFIGSIEVEFFSTVNLFFPYPAVVINYYGPYFCSVVHTAQRVYNDFDDRKANSQTVVPESGFNIYAEDSREPFIGLINGPSKVPEGKISMKFFNVNNEVLEHELELGEMAPYQTFFLYPARLMKLKEFLGGKVGAGKIKFNVDWIFPRLVVGNIQTEPSAMTITHTYYDCSQATSNSDYWLQNQPEWYPASLMVPLCIANEQFTNIYFYPVYSPSEFAIDIEIYNAEGQLLGKKENVLEIKSPCENLKQVDLLRLCHELNIPPQKELSARINARSIGESRFPARVKLGLDMGYLWQSHMPCNICTNLQPFNPTLETKPTTFRWSPILADQPEATLWILNSSPAKDYSKTAEVQLNFYREQDTETISRKISIPPHGFTVIHAKEDSELSSFFGDSIGWCTMLSSNPYTSGYYFAANPSGVIGGDHSF